MSPDLRDLLDDAARAPQRRLDLDDIHHRARRSRALEVGAAVAVVALVLAGVAFGVTRLAEERAPAPFISEGPVVTPSSADSPADSGDRMVTAPDLDAEVFLAVDVWEGEGHMLKMSPDGRTSTLPVEVSLPSVIHMHVDDLGGFVYQARTEGGGSSAIREVGPSGVTETRVPATSDEADTYVLLGHAEGRSLVARRTGTTPQDTTVDLLEVGHLGADPRVVAQDVAGWEGAVTAAASLEVAVYVRHELDGSSVVVHPPDRDPVVVWRGDEASGEEAVDVDIVGSDGAFALIATPDGAELRSIDIFGTSPRTIDRVEVPLTLGTDARDVEATELSIHTQYILVNRRASGAWLRPLVHDLSAPGTWSVFERPGRALLGRAVPMDDVAEPPCASDDGIRNTPPDDDTLHRYLLCAGGEQMHADAYRHPSELEPSGDPATDARAVLDLVLRDLDPELAARGYVDVAATANGSIGVHDVRFADGTLVVDFDFPDGGVGNLNTATGGAMWSTFVRANLLQLDGVEVLELHADGSCEAYTTSFEGSGCLRHTPADAPWSSRG
ncbi:MAG TPA: hypothetical protein VGA36_06595 [Nitriliruptorales bacterium]